MNNKKSLTTYFMIPIIMVIVFLTIMLSLALFTPKNYILKIYGYDGQDAVATYRAPQSGKVLYTHLEKTTRAGYSFEGYYFERTEEKDGSGKVTYIYDEEDRVPDDYKICENITLYVKWVKQSE